MEAKMYLEGYETLDEIEKQLAESDVEADDRSYEVEILYESYELEEDAHKAFERLKAKSIQLDAVGRLPVQDFEINGDWIYAYVERAILRVSVAVARGIPVLAHDSRKARFRRAVEGLADDAPVWLWCPVPVIHGVMLPTEDVVAIAGAVQIRLRNVKGRPVIQAEEVRMNEGLFCTTAGAIREALAV